MAEAFQISLDKAGYNETSVKSININESAEEDGRAIYKISFYVGPVAFGYHTDKVTGEVLKSEVIAK